MTNSQDLRKVHAIRDSICITHHSYYLEEIMHYKLVRQIFLSKMSARRIWYCKISSRRRTVVVYNFYGGYYVYVSSYHFSMSRQAHIRFSRYSFPSITPKFTKRGYLCNNKYILRLLLPIHLHFLRAYVDRIIELILFVLPSTKSE